MKLSTVLKILGFIAIFGLAIWLGHLAQNNDFVKNFVSRYGYFALFIISFIGGLNLFVPVPVIAFMPVFLAAGLDFWLVLIIMTIGMSLADSLAFIIADFAGQKPSVEDSRIVKFLRKIKHKSGYYPYGVMFLFSTFAPLPNETLLIPMGLVGYKMRYLVAPIILGNFLFNLIYAFGFINLLKRI